MTDVILGTIIITMMAERAYTAYEHRKQEKEYIKAVLAKNLTELSQADTNERIDPNTEQEEPDLVPMESADDTLFNEALQHINNKEN